MINEFITIGYVQLINWYVWSHDFQLTNYHSHICHLSLISVLQMTFGHLHGTGGSPSSPACFNCDTMLRTSLGRKPCSGLEDAMNAACVFCGVGWWGGVSLRSLPISTNGQLLVWGPAVWDSRGTPKFANPFHKGIPGIQTIQPKPPTQTTH